MIGVTAGLLAALVAAPAEAPPLALAWRAPPACPDAADVLRRLDALVPTRPISAPGLRAEGLVAALPGGSWRLELVLRGPGIDDARTIDANTCTTLADVAALLLAIAVAPEAVASRQHAVAAAPVEPLPPRRESLPRREPPPPRETVVAPAPLAQLEPGDVAPSTRPPPRRAHAVRGALRLAGGAEVGAIPRWSPTAALAAALLGPGWRVELAGTYSTRNLAYDDPPGAGGRLQLVAGALRGCGVPRWRRLEFPVCAGLELGLLRGVARGVASPRPAGDLWIAAGLGAGAVWRVLENFAVVVGLEVAIGLRRPGFHVETLGELARSQAVGLRPTLGVELRFP